MSNPMKDIIEKFLMSVCGFTADAAKEITKNQGYDDLDKFYLLDDKGVDTLCFIVRKPHALACGTTSGLAISNIARMPQIGDICCEALQACVLQNQP
jgi:hypothetical protein